MTAVALQEITPYLGPLPSASMIPTMFNTVFYFFRDYPHEVTEIIIRYLDKEELVCRIAICWNCRKQEEDKLAGDNNKFKICVNCKIAKYCSKECQVSDWLNHKTDCKKGDLAIIRMLKISENLMIKDDVDDVRMVEVQREIAAATQKWRLFRQRYPGQIPQAAIPEFKALKRDFEVLQKEAKEIQKKLAFRRKAIGKILEIGDELAGKNSENQDASTK